MTARPWALLAILALAVSPVAARADFNVCNKTKHMAGVAIAHSNGLEWISEGWWNVAPGACATILKGGLKARYYYLHAIHYEVGGGWEGDRTFCTARRSFTITGRDACQGRGFEETGFFEVDTGNAPDWTQVLSDDP